MKRILDYIVGKLNKADDRNNMDFKDLERKVGFIVNLYMAYLLIAPLIKVFYLNMNYWREGRDNNGRKISKQAYEYF